MCPSSSKSDIETIPYSLLAADSLSDSPFRLSESDDPDEQRLGWLGSSSIFLVRDSVSSMLSLLTSANHIAATQPDPYLSLLVGALGASIVGLLGGFAGASIQSRREHSRWVREQRIDAYRDFLRATEQMWPSQSPEQSVWRAFMDEMGSALGVLTIVGPDVVTTAASAHLDAVLDFGSVQRRRNGLEDGTPKPELQQQLIEQGARVTATRDFLVKAARQPLRIND